MKSGGNPRGLVMTVRGAIVRTSKILILWFKTFFNLVICKFSRLILCSAVGISLQMTSQTFTAAVGNKSN